MGNCLKRPGLFLVLLLFAMKDIKQCGVGINRPSEALATTD